MEDIVVGSNAAGKDGGGISAASASAFWRTRGGKSIEAFKIQHVGIEFGNPEVPQVEQTYKEYDPDHLGYLLPS